MGELLKQLNFSRPANRKTRDGESHPDRDARFGHLNHAVGAALAALAAKGRQGPPSNR